MSTTPLFSVLIANYNNGKYLQDAINSVLAQTYTHWEIVIVDDGSTDNSKEIISKYNSDNRFVIHYNERNMGCGHTKYRCAELTTGELCAFLDADDVLLPNALENHVEAHLKNKDHSCVFSRYYKCNEDLSILEESRPISILDGSDYFTSRNYGPEHLVSFKKYFYNLTPGISPDIPAAVDQDLYFKLEEVAPIKILDKFTYKYRHTPNQISQGRHELKTFYWNLYVRHQTCLRRGFDPSNFPILDFEQRFLPYMEELPCVQKDLLHAQSELSRIRNSWAFRIGKFFLQPLSWIRKSVSQGL